jgi:hypothetical protein
MHTDAQTRLDAEMSQLEAGFKPRQNAFSTPSPKLTAYLDEHASAFSEVTSHLSGLSSFKWAVSSPFPGQLAGVKI